MKAGDVSDAMSKMSLKDAGENEHGVRDEEFSDDNSDEEKYVETRLVVDI